MGRRIGIMGGSFDPIHIGHLVAAEEARVQFNLDRVIFMPSHQNPFKDRVTTAGEHRFLMVQLAVASNPDFEVSREEIDRPGPSYTIDTVRAIKARHPEDELFFITGADAVVEILQWKESAEIASLVTFIAATRPGYDIAKARKLHEEAGNGFTVFTIEVPALAVSSTDLRERLATGRAVRYLMPDAVIGYVRKMHLYEGFESHNEVPVDGAKSPHNEGSE